MIAEATAWYLLITITIRGSSSFTYPEMFVSEAECDYAGQAFEKRAKEKGFRIDYLCWNNQKPPIRKMGGR